MRYWDPYKVVKVGLVTKGLCTQEGKLPSKVFDLRGDGCARAAPPAIAAIASMYLVPIHDLNSIACELLCSLSQQDEWQPTKILFCPTSWPTAVSSTPAPGWRRLP